MLHAAINGLSQRQQVIADDLTATVSATGTPVGANDNNVDLRKESITALQTQYQYQIMGRAISDRDSRLRVMAGGA